MDRRRWQLLKTLLKPRLQKLSSPDPPVQKGEILSLFQSLGQDWQPFLLGLLLFLPSSFSDEGLDNAAPLCVVPQTQRAGMKFPSLAPANKDVTGPTAPQKASPANPPEEFCYHTCWYGRFQFSCTRKTQSCWTSEIPYSPFLFFSKWQYALP